MLPTVTGLLPRRALHCLDWVHLTGLELADPYYAVPGAVDCIFGADLYLSLILEGLRIGAAQAPVAQQTKLGWILTGPTIDPPPITSHATVVSCATTLATSEVLRRFWEVEEVPATPTLTPEDEECGILKRLIRLTSVDITLCAYRFGLSRNCSDLGVQLSRACY